MHKGSFTWLSVLNGICNALEKVDFELYQKQ